MIEEGEGGGLGALVSRGTARVLHRILRGGGGGGGNSEHFRARERCGCDREGPGRTEGAVLVPRGTARALRRNLGGKEKRGWYSAGTQL